MFVEFGSRLSGQIIGIPKGTNVLILLSLSDNNKADVIEEFGSTLG